MGAVAAPHATVFCSLSRLVLDVVSNMLAVVATAHADMPPRIAAWWALPCPRTVDNDVKRQAYVCLCPFVVCVCVLCNSGDIISNLICCLEPPVRCRGVCGWLVVVACLKR